MSKETVEGITKIAVTGFKLLGERVCNRHSSADDSCGRE